MEKHLWDYAVVAPANEIVLAGYSPSETICGVLLGDLVEFIGFGFSMISVDGQSDVVADAPGDVLTLIAGDNITITTLDDSITISATAGIDGADGSVWRNGIGDPDNGLGVNGDYYLDNATGDVWEKSAGVYSVVANIVGPQGPAGPGLADGDKGDIVVSASGTAWTIDNNVVTLAKMAAGTAGNLITYDGSGDPVAISTGTAGQVLTSNGAGAAPTFQAASGGTVLASHNDFRLTLTSGTPVLTADTTAAGTLYLTPFKGKQIALYNGSAWEILSSAEVSLSLILTSGKNYDVFAYNNAGTLTLELSAAWTNATTRADAITTQDGVYVKSGATTRRLVGTIYATGTNQTGMKFGRTAAAGGSAPFCAVWNMDNRVRHSFFNLDSVTSATRTLDASWRWYNWLASSSNIFTFVHGMASNVRGDFRALGSNTAGTFNAGIGLDVSGLPNTTAASGIMAGTNSTSAVLTQASAIFDQSVGIGMHVLSLLEMPNAANDTTFFGDLGLAGTQFQSGACFEVEA